MTNPPTDPDAFNYGPGQGYGWPPPPPPRNRHRAPEPQPVEPTTGPIHRPPQAWQMPDRTTNPHQTQAFPAQPQWPTVGQTQFIPVPVAPVPVSGTQEVPAQPQGTTVAPGGAQRAERPFWQTWWVWVIALVAILFLTTPSSSEIQEAARSGSGTSCEVVEPAQPQPTGPAAAPDTAPERG